MHIQWTTLLHHRKRSNQTDGFNDRCTMATPSLQSNPCQLSKDCKVSPECASHFLISFKPSSRPSLVRNPAYWYSLHQRSVSKPSYNSPHTTQPPLCRATNLHDILKRQIHRKSYFILFSKRKWRNPPGTSFFEKNKNRNWVLHPASCIFIFSLGLQWAVQHVTRCSCCCSLHFCQFLSKFLTKDGPPVVD